MIVIFTRHITVAGVPLIIILFVAMVLLGELVKKAGSAEPSFFAVTCIFIPLGGIAEVICISRGKSGPGAGASVVPLAGVICTVRRASLLLLLFLLFLQAGVAINAMTARDKNKIFFMILV